jgi:hypothetical protein
MQTMITVIYYLMIAASSLLLVANFLKTKDWQREILYMIVLIPFLLRLLMLK